MKARKEESLFPKTWCRCFGRSHTETHSVPWSGAQFVGVIFSTVACKHDQSHHTAQSQSQLQGRKHHVARPAERWEWSESVTYYWGDGQKHAYINRWDVKLENKSNESVNSELFMLSVYLTASFSVRALRYLWTWAWFTPYRDSMRKTPPTPRVQKVCLSVGSGFRLNQRERIQTILSEQTSTTEDL